MPWPQERSRVCPAGSLRQQNVSYSIVALLTSKASCKGSFMRLVRLICALFCGIAVSTFVSAQNVGTGLYAFGSFDSRGFDSINIGNLNTHFIHSGTLITRAF